MARGNVGSTDKKSAERSGRHAETLAAWFLLLKGYRIVDRRLRTPAGEIDIVALKRGVLVIIEVKRRKSQTAALEAVTYRQRQRLARAAAYISGHYSQPSIDRGLRFDVVVVQPWHWPRHLKDAWRPEPY